MKQEQVYEEVNVDEEVSSEHSFLFGDKDLLVAKWALYLLAFLTPLFFLPYTVSPLFAKEVLAYVLLGIALIGWLAHFLASGKLVYKHSWINLSLFVLLVVTIISVFRSESLFMSLWGPDVTGEKLAALIAFAVLYFLASSLFTKEEVIKIIGVMYAALLLAGVWSLLQMFHVYLFPFEFARRSDFNSVGTINALAMFYGLFFVIGVGILLHLKQIIADVFFKKIFTWTVFLASAILLVNILLISLPRVVLINGLTLVTRFPAVWFGIGLAMIVFLGQSFRNAYRGQTSGTEYARAHFGLSYYIPLIILVFSSLFYFVSTPIFGSALADIPVEVTPTFSATIDIAKNAIQSSPVFGSGPATFAFDYNAYRGADINQTIFWSVKFFHGFSFLTTLPATTGILGILSWLFFIGSVVFILFGSLFRENQFDPIKLSIFCGVCFSVAGWLFYASNFTSLLFVFFLVGLFAARSEDSSCGGRWVITNRFVTVLSSAFMFVASLVAIFLIVLSVVAMYFGVQKYIAEAYYYSAVRTFNTTGNVDSADERFVRAITIDPNNDIYLRADGQVRLVKMQQVINRALGGGGQDVQADFQASFNAARTVITAATRVNPREPQNWSVLGLLYENLIPFIGGADQLAINAYQEAVKQDPTNPAVLLDVGRTFLESADAIQSRIGQIQDRAEVSRLTAVRLEYLTQAEGALTKATSLKADYAPAHFLLAQVFTRKDDLASAIRKTEDTKSLSPLDVGVAFQLGFLYYQAGSFDKAVAEFERAVSLNANYSNARYFLGLIYDRQGNKALALEQFEKVGSLNPDNQEVKTIIKNLKAGLPALAGIVPPAPAPEKRGSAPVSDTGGTSNVVTPK